MRRPLFGPLLLATLPLLLALPRSAAAQPPAAVESLTKAVEAKVIAWRRDIHQNPELGNHEFRTARLVTDHLRGLGLEVKTGVAKTGVVAILRGGKPGPVIALRADMDALPVTEEVDLPFASKVKAEWAGKETGVMHACGHDTHVAILMGVAEILATLRDDLPGTVKFLFQPAEEGLPPGEEGGALLMIREGAMENPKPEAVFGLHIESATEAGKLSYRPGPHLASSDTLRIKVKGRQTHGGVPWGGVDPVVAAAQIVLGLQTIASRQINIVKQPAVVSIGSIHGGNRSNIIPDEVELLGTIRTFDEKNRDEVHRLIRQTAENIAAAAGAKAEVVIDRLYDVTVNDPALTARMAPTLERVAGAGNVIVSDLRTGAEDFAFLAQQAPGFYFFLGGSPPGTDLAKVAVNHSPLFYVDESSLLLGVRAMTQVAIDYLGGAPQAKDR
jgi:amidohydrolase